MLVLKKIMYSQNLVATGKAMRCTKCTAVVQKEVGCDAILCVVRSVELFHVSGGINN